MPDHDTATVQLIVDAIYGPADHPAPGQDMNRTGSRLWRKGEAVLDALTAAGWRRTVPLPEWPAVEAEGRRQAAADILAWVDAQAAVPPDAALAYYHAAEIAHATTPTTEGDPDAR